MRGSEFENRVRHAAKPKSPTESPAPRLSNGPDADALRAALSDAVASPVPAPSPSRKRQRIVYGDRCVACCSWELFGSPRKASYEGLKLIEVFQVYTESRRGGFAS